LSGCRERCERKKKKQVKLNERFIFIILFFDSFYFSDSISTKIKLKYKVFYRGIKAISIFQQVA